VSGKIIPNFGADASALNFGGQLLGWHPYIEEFLQEGIEVPTPDDTPVYITLATFEVGDVRQVDVIAKVAKADGTVRQTFKLSGLYYGAAGPTATQDTYSAVGTGTGTAVISLEVTGAIVRLKIVGIAATALVTTYDASVI
jgi:hypothetical protein